MNLPPYPMMTAEESKQLAERMAQPKMVRRAAANRGRQAKAIAKRRAARKARR